MIDFQYDKRIVMTLDAGGTNFVFSALQGGEDIVQPVCLPSNGDNLEKCLSNLQEGFRKVLSQLKHKPVAISFAFPGPADYPAGIIGDLNNLPAFKGGIALGPMLENEFKLPVFINNDGDLFAYGEALAGFLPKVNNQLKTANSPKKFRNLFGITLGTGFGGGFYNNGNLFIGDNSAGSEIWVMRNKKYPKAFIEESASIRAVKRSYAEFSETNDETLTPRDIFDIADGKREGDQKAALAAFAELGEMVGDALADIACVTDSLIVIGGGLSGASRFFMPALVKKMNDPFEDLNANLVPRLETKVFNLEDNQQFSDFIKGEVKQIVVPGNPEKITYDSMKRIGVGISSLGTSKAISIGAYCLALQSLK
jgi:glucokinase